MISLTDGVDPYAPSSNSRTSPKTSLDVQDLRYCRWMRMSDDMVIMIDPSG
jgi:hypothetical protein